MRWRGHRTRPDLPTADLLSAARPRRGGPAERPPGLFGGFFGASGKWPVSGPVRDALILAARPLRSRQDRSNFAKEAIYCKPVLEGPLRRTLDKEPTMSDVAFVLLTVAVFALLGLVVKGVEKL
ncbi:hypothetical protein AB0L25_18875 [Spirillospora sp. NPDC052242]